MQEKRSIYIEAVAMKGCPARFVGGNYKIEQHHCSSYRLIKGALSNYTDFGMFGELFSATSSYFEKDINQLVESLQAKMPFWKRFYKKIYLKWFFQDKY